MEVLWVHQGMEQYGTICDDKWTIEEARVICRQLGYFDARAAYGQAFFGEGEGMILLDDVACTGMETDIVQCAHSYWMDTNCLSSEDAGVVCVPGILKMVNVKRITILKEYAKQYSNDFHKIRNSIKQHVTNFQFALSLAYM